MKATRENEKTLTEWRGGEHTGWVDNLIMLSDKSWGDTEINLEDYTEISFEQFKKYVVKLNNTQENKIIGFRLIKPEYKSAIEKITNTITFNYEALENNPELIPYELLKLRDSGVLNLWFEPIYQKEYKIGDWVITKGYSNVYDGKALQITKIIVEENIKYAYCKDGTVNKLNISKHIKRKATETEILNSLVEDFKKYFTGLKVGKTYFFDDYNNDKFKKYDLRLRKDYNNLTPNCKKWFDENPNDDYLLVLFFDLVVVPFNYKFKEVVEKPDIVKNQHNAKFCDEYVEFGVDRIYIKDLKHIDWCVDKFSGHTQFTNITIGECEFYIGEIKQILKYYDDLGLVKKKY